jgi:hypothetical protein
VTLALGHNDLQLYSLSSQHRSPHGHHHRQTRSPATSRGTTRLLYLPFLWLLASTSAAQSPTFTGIVNPASNIPPGLPNSGIAQGSILVVYGSNLGPATLVLPTTLPLPTTAGLAGTSIFIAQRTGPSVAVPMIYTSAGQVAAVMPSNAPLGTDTLTLTYNGKERIVRRHRGAEQLRNLDRRGIGQRRSCGYVREHLSGHGNKLG